MTGAANHGSPSRVDAPPSARTRHEPTALIGITGALALLLAPQVASSGLGLTLLSHAGVAIIACLAYNLLFGEGGMVSFGHAIYSGIGAYLAIHTLAQAWPGAAGVPVVWVPLVGGAAGWALAAVLGWVTTRRAGTPFAMITLGLGELVWALALMLPEFSGGEQGVAANRVRASGLPGVTFGPALEVYYLIAAYCLACTWALHAFTRTPLGRALNAVRDDPVRAEFIGYSARHVRWLALMVSGFFSGVAGALGAIHTEIVTPEVFGTARSGAYLLFVLMGGSTLFFGPVVGAVLMVWSQMVWSQWTPAWLLYLGLAFIVTLLAFPGGLAALAASGWRLACGGQLAARAGPWLALCGTAAVAMAGGAAIVEMLYQRQFGAALGSEVRFLGVMLDVRRADAWIGAAWVALTGAVLFELCRRHGTARECADG
jgi:branched-chain amino acid transport system permease protein